MLFRSPVFSRGRADPPGLDRLAAVAGEDRAGAHIAHHYPVTDVPHTVIARVVDVIDGRLPGVVTIRLPRSGTLNVQLLDRESVWPVTVSELVQRYEPTRPKREA